ncbi:MAG: fasciclin domain-containing protein [Gemmatimonadaceae bacterium]
MFCRFGSQLLACAPKEAASADAAPAAAGAGQSGVKDDESQKDVENRAVSSKDHTTLVAAVKAAGLVDALSNAGPFTVFAPTNAAFDALPKGTVDDAAQAREPREASGILKHHVTTSALEVSDLSDGPLAMADGGSTTITHQGKDVLIDGAKIPASVRGSNGMVHVIDKVIVPPPSRRQPLGALPSRFLGAPSPVAIAAGLLSLGMGAIADHSGESPTGIYRVTSPAPAPTAALDISPCGPVCGAAEYDSRAALIIQVTPSGPA